MAKALVLTLIVGLGGLAVVAGRLEPPVGADSARPAAHSDDADTGRYEAQPIGNGAAGFALDRAPDSHFYADAQVNGARIRFMIDTGASSVVLTREDAQRAGIAIGAFDAVGTGAGGEIKLARVSIDRLALGPVAANRVEAMVAERGLPVSLLGQSFLSRIGRVEISDDRMILR